MSGMDARVQADQGYLQSRIRFNKSGLSSMTPPGKVSDAHRPMLVPGTLFILIIKPKDLIEENGTPNHDPLCTLLRTPPFPNGVVRIPRGQRLVPSQAAEVPAGQQRPICDSKTSFMGSIKRGKAAPGCVEPRNKERPILSGFIVPDWTGSGFREFRPALGQVLPPRFRPG